MAQSLTLDKAVAQIQESAAAVKKQPKAAKTQRVNSPVAGRNIRQGDVYITFLKELPKGLGKWEPRGEAEMPASEMVEVEGKQVRQKRIKLTDESNKGGQHFLRGEFEIGFNKTDLLLPGQKTAIPRELVGPHFKCTSECEVEHPAHGNFILPAGTVGVVTFQRLFDKDQAIVRRIKD